VQSIVIATLRDHLGWPGDMPLDAVTFADLSVDSVVLVSVMLEVADQVGVDLAAADPELAAVQTVDDVVRFVRSAAPSPG
jgi:acyl carrier protein